MNPDDLNELRLWLLQNAERHFRYNNKALMVERLFDQMSPTNHKMECFTMS